MNEDKKITFLLFLLNVLITIQCILWYLQCCQLFHPGAGAGEVGEQLNQTAGIQQQVTAGISSAQDTAKDISGTITESQGTINQATVTAGRIDGEIRTSGEIIRDCQSILATVQSRGAKEVK